MFTCREYKFEDSPDWEKLIEISQTASFFQTKRWLKIWLENFPVKNTVIVIFNEKNPVGIAAFSINEDKILFLGNSPVLGNELVSDYGDIVAVNGMEEIVLSEILSYLKKNF